MIRRKIILRYAVALGTLLLIAGIYGYVNLRSAQDRDAIQTIREWARLVELPATATDIRVQTSGSPFTRDFTVTFVAPREDVEAWLHQSPGTTGLTPKTEGSIQKYDIQPGGGAQHADLEFDPHTGAVKIHAYWS